MVLIRNIPITDCISVWANLHLQQKGSKREREEERMPGLISDGNGLMGQHSMRSLAKGNTQQASE